MYPFCSRLYRNSRNLGSKLDKKKKSEETWTKKEVNYVKWTLSLQTFK